MNETLNKSFIKFIPFDQNVLEVALSEISEENTLLLFPTRRSKQKAQKLYQPNWDFTEHKFLTMDEWKESLSASDKPILKEEKRTLALYLSLSDDAKRFFKINTYHQSIAFAQNIFKFWEEITEELVADENIIEILSQKQTAGNWQLETFEFLKTIKENYLHFLNGTNFTDYLFTRNTDNFPANIEYSKIVVVNQFYFTKFEKKLLKEFKENVIILSQIPQECFDEDTLTISNFDARHIEPFVQNKLKLYTSSQPLEMIMQLVSNLENNETVIDFQFERQPYASLLSRQKFAIPAKSNFSTTRIFRFFQIIHDIFNSINRDGKPFLLSMQSLLDAFVNDEFWEYFVAEPIRREDLRTFLFKLVDRDFKFIDLEYFDNKEHKQDFEKIFSFLQKFKQVNDLKDFIKFLTNEIDIDLLLSPDKDKTNIVEVFFTALSDFASLEDISLITNWKDIFPKEPAANFLKLWLDYLKAKEIKYELETDGNRISVTSLQDTRNLQFNEVFILNVVEGILPDRKHTQFLFSENQRKQLGLKTYEDITMRDKYYFYRLVACSRNVSAFTRKNLQGNIEISSFLEELKMQDLVEEVESGNFNLLHQHLFRELIEDKDIPKKNIITDDFFSFKHIHFPENKLNLSFYRWEKLKNNPFEYYLEYSANIKAREPEINNDFSSKLIGSIAHNIINLVVKRMLENNSNSFNFIHNTKLYVDQAVEHYIKYDRYFKYISPHNFSNNYFSNIFVPILKNGIENFFYRLHNDLKLSDKPISLFPETVRTMGKKYFDLDDLEIHLHGRSDLRIHTQNQKFIFDFKTGNTDYSKLKRFGRQLQFYELIYYLIDSPSMIDDISSYLFFIEQKDMKSISKRLDMKSEITDVLQNIIENGFMVSERKNTYEEIDITRRDLKMKTELIK